jgi:hypothetical protein
MFDHVGLRVKNLEAAARLYAAILAPLGHVPGASGEAYAGFGPKGAPGLRTDYAPNYYAAFVLDADGNNVEAVFME